MATASTQMIDKLAQDGAAVGKALEKLTAYVKENNSSAVASTVETLDKTYKVLAPRIEKWAREVLLKPPIFASEDDYKKIRAALTAITPKVVTSTKKMAEEIKANASAVVVKVVSGAVSEVLIKDAKMAQALTMVAQGNKGRAGPKEEGTKEYSHIHIGGNAKENLIFQPGKKLVLGVLNFHLDSENSKSQKEQTKKVASRSGAVVELKIINKEITRA